jgi:hypothetical protein
MKKIKAYRHGEILFCEVKEIPREAKFKKTNTLLVGSGSNPHTFKGGRFYNYNSGIIFGYFEAKNTKLYHKEHGNKQVGGLREAILSDGIYELRRGQEFISSELKPIID